jgi:PTH1 family peptidyl-tRNA hydrolase
MSVVSIDITPTYLIVGLGNPGRKYARNRHNVGFMVVDRLAIHLGVKFTRMEFKALVAKETYQGKRLILAKPQTFMNDSGKAAGALLNFYKLAHENLLVVYDDVDLPLGVLRLRPAGGSAGQKGMRSIIERLGVETFPRLRVGIGRPPGRMEAADYVLQDFSKAETEILGQLLDFAVEATLTAITQGIDKAMNQFNRQTDERDSCEAK